MYIEWPEIHYAAQEGDINKVKQLLKQGVSIDTVDSIGYTPLHVAAMENNIELVKLLLEEGADINYQGENIRINNPCKGYTTPLMVAVHRGRLELVELFLKAGADLLLCDGEGETALDSAIGLHANNPLASRDVNRYAEKIDLLKSYLSTAHSE